MDSMDFKIILDVHDMSAPISLNVKQGDAGRKIAITLTKDGIPVHLAKGSYAVFAGKKPDEMVLWNSCSIDGDTIIYEITKQTTAVVGWVPVQIRLYSPGGNLISSPDFVLIVDGTVTDDDEVVSISENEVTALTELVSEVSTAIEHAYNVEGKSAYQVAVDAGFEGTEEEWLLSLVGKQGREGPQGKQGPIGPQGEQGASTTISLLYGVSSAPLENTIITWQDTIPQMSETYPYLWIEISTETMTATGVSASIERGIIGYYSTGGEGTVQQQGFDFPATKDLNMNSHTIRGVDTLDFSSRSGDPDSGVYMQNEETLYADGYVSGQVLSAYGSFGDEPVILRNIHKPIQNDDAATKQYVDEAVSSSGGGNYTLPVASPTVLGGVKPAAKSDDMTEPVGVDASGKLFTKPGGGGGIEVTGAAVGQIVKIAAVDGSGVPTAWEPADLPSGGGGSAYKVLVDKTVEGSDTLRYVHTFTIPDDAAILFLWFSWVENTEVCLSIGSSATIDWGNRVSVGSGANLTFNCVLYKFADKWLIHRTYGSQIATVTLNASGSELGIYANSAAWTSGVTIKGGVLA